MADITEFPEMRDVLHSGDNIHTFTAGGDIKAGQVVEISGDFEVVKATTLGTKKAIGVALYDAASGEEIAIAMRGCIVWVANADDTTAISAGEYVMADDNAVGGTVKKVDDLSVSVPPGTTAVTSTAAQPDLTEAGGVPPQVAIGTALEEISGGGTGRILLH